MCVLIREGGEDAVAAELANEELEAATNPQPKRTLTFFWLALTTSPQRLLRYGPPEDVGGCVGSKCRTRPDVQQRSSPGDRILSLSHQGSGYCNSNSELTSTQRHPRDRILSARHAGSGY
jgi:hypothetical protein